MARKCLNINSYDHETRGQKYTMHFWTAYGKCTCKSKIIPSTLYPLDTFRYDTVLLSMTISHLQIAVFLTGSAFSRPVVQP